MNHKAPLGYRFEGFSLLLDKRVLLRNGTRTRLRCREFNTLLLLLQNAPRPVTREQFALSVWQKTAVEDSNLTVTISGLRKILGDSAGESRHIDTIPKEGYRFIPTVTPIASLGPDEDGKAQLRRHVQAEGRRRSRPEEGAALPGEAEPHRTASGRAASEGKAEEEHAPLARGAEPHRTAGGRAAAAKSTALETPGRSAAGKGRADELARVANSVALRGPRRKRALPICSSVPAPLVSLIGRDRELRELSDLLSRPGVRLGTLVGAGGSGKTELGQQTAAGAAKHFRDGVVFVSLASITDPGLVGSAIAQSLGIRESGTQSLNDTLANSLRRKKLLLLLDNFEHLISAAEFVVWLLRLCPRLTVLVTSRAPLRVSGEHVYPVEPLPLPDEKKKPTVQALADCSSGALFVERARAARGDFTVTAQNAAAIAEICATTGGLPLAIELAAAQAGLLSLDEMLASSERRRLDLFTGGRRDAPNRQQTMSKNIEWSHQLLSAEEKRLFARLSVFVGGFTKGVAEAVCGDPENANAGITEALTSLLENRLITLERVVKSGLEPRFNMLEVIREYGVDRLAASGERETIRQRHAEFFCDLAEQAEPKLIGPTSVVTLDLLEAELGNLRAAMRWSVGNGNAEVAARTAAAMRVFWINRGSLQEGRQWLEDALRDGSDLTKRTMAKALSAAGRLLDRRSEFGSAAAILETALDLSRELCDTEGEAYTLLVLGDVYERQGDYRQAIQAYEEGLAISRGMGYKWILGCLLTSVATVAHYRGDDKQALELDEEALAIFRELDDRRSVAHALNNIGFLLTLQGDHLAGASNFTEGLCLLDGFCDSIRVSEVLESMAASALGIGDSTRACLLLGACETIREDAGFPRSPALDLECKGILTAAAHALGPAHFTKAWKAGRSMTMEEAMAYALKSTEPRKARSSTGRLKNAGKQLHRTARA